MSGIVEEARASALGGLSEAEAGRRLEAEGYNELPAPERRGVLRIVREVLSEPMFGLLIGAGVIYFFLGDRVEAFVLTLFATFSVSIAVVQETRSERVLEALRDLTSPRALVMRDGEKKNIAGRDVARGDLLLIAEGDRMPADGVLVEGEGVETDESLLTGESVPVRKRVVREGDEATLRPGGDDLPLLFSGTLVVRGGGRVVATATGVRSEIGRIGHSLASIETEPPRLRAQTRRLVRFFAAGGASLSILVVVLYAWLRGSFVEALLAGIAVGMSLLPEEFPLVLTVFMVMGAWRISQVRVLTRRAAAIETLGSATVLCTDKTGTLTRNHMTIVDIRAGTGDVLAEVGGGDDASKDGSNWAASSAETSPAGSAGTPMSPAPMRLVEAGLLASSRDALDPMDRAFHELAAAEHADMAALLSAHEVVREFGLSSDLMAVTTVCRREGSGLVAFSKGAPEAVASLCGLPDEGTRAMLAALDEMASKGMRVLAVAAGELEGEAIPDSPRGLPFRFLGLAGFADPLRPGVPGAVAQCRRAGIRVVMITGDYSATAQAIAKQAGISGEETLSGDELAMLGDAALAARVRTVSVFARILPEQKLRIVEAFKSAGEVVGMTGDGVNDAPSLKAAHIGIAMGGRGTDVAREASSIVLLDDDFGSIVTTIRLGRRIYDNLRKAMGYVIALHVPIAGLAVLPLLLGMPLILTPMIIAFLEMIIDPVCSIVLEAEPEESDVMDRPPRDPAAALLPPALLGWCFLQGAVAFALVAAIFVTTVSRGLPETEARSLAFFSLVTTNIALIFANRSFSGSLLEALRRPNALLWKGLLVATSLLGVVLWWEPARELFRLGRVDMNEVGLCIGAGVVLLVLLQGMKGFWKSRLEG